MTPLDLLTIAGVVVSYSYTAFLWKSDKSRQEKDPKVDILSCRLCKKTRNRCCCGSSYLKNNEDLYKATTYCSYSDNTVKFVCDDGRMVTMPGNYSMDKPVSDVLLIRRTQGEVTTHHYLDERIRVSRM